MARRGEWVEYTPVLSASVAQPAVPLVYIVVGYDCGNGTFWTHEVDVVGVVAKVVGRYQRPRNGDLDLGTPRRPPSPKSLADEGYRTQFGHRDMEYACLVVGECGVEEYEESSNTTGILWEKGCLPVPEEVIEREKQSLRRRCESQQ